MSSDPSGRKGYRRIAPSSVRVRLHPAPSGRAFAPHRWSALARPRPHILATTRSERQHGGSARRGGDAAHHARARAAAGAAVTDARVHFRVNVSARMLPRHLRELFKREVTERLLARCDEHVSVAPTCCAGCERNERHYHRGHRPPRGRVRHHAGRVADRLVALGPQATQRPGRKRPCMTRGSRLASRSTRSAAISPPAASWPGALPRCRWAACADASRSRCCPTSPSSYFGSTVPRGWSATGAAAAPSIWNKTWS